ncbi:MAG: riboflavin synthase [bacterium]|uniref:Riboflavin synthase n=1 Tax=candidate division TA06 bacterium 34_109 TaxID=1635277 RepID=A0A117M6N0_UNCT6|nr:MAG: Riboflavin synthase, alpha subunit [candidate division TA06 bacterium 32_111]KUK87249.1 MAG: Riboflavin synthase, alpha subunit [candidate division TA06 bacterium 34_109]MDI6700493.1 riboflavin synthase [bacterium]HCP16168.1 riboflavin synthase [candidate division WOR-3 bacterium]
MFTGIVKETGKIYEIRKKSEDYILTLEVSKSFLEDVKEGDSISVDGVCLTVERVWESFLRFYALSQSAEKSIIRFYKKNKEVNLEKSMRVDDRFGGHIVLGHVDTTGYVKKIIKPNRNKVEIEIDVGSKFSKFLVENDSISVNGISLTIKNVFENSFILDIIPETLKITNLKNLNVGERVNIEINQITKNIYKFLKEKNNV